MNLEEIKDPSSLSIDGLGVSFIKDGAIVTDITLSANGKKYIIRKANDYSNGVKLFHMNPKTEKAVTLLTWTFKDLSGEKIFETYTEAKEYSDKLTEDFDRSDDFSVEIRTDHKIEIAPENQEPIPF